MAYNYFPVNYQYPQQTFYQPQMPVQQSTMGQVNQQAPVNYGSSNTIIWVNSETEAQNYPVAPNNAVALWDSSKAAIYLKQADASGRPSFKAFDLVEHKTADLSGENKAVNNFISKDDIDGLKAEIEALRGILKQEINSKKAEVKEDE